MRSYSIPSIVFTMLLLFLSTTFFASLGQALITYTATETGIPVPTLPAYMYTSCDTQTGASYPGNDSLIDTTARMMDWCGCENKLNPDGLAYAGMSVYDDVIKADAPPHEQPARTWICAANGNTACDSETDWYHALANVSATCNNGTNNKGNGTYGYFYDAQRQIAWGFGTFWDTKFCEDVAWIGIAK